MAKQEDINNKIEELQSQLDNLRKEKWQYKVGDVVITHGYIRCRILELLDDDPRGYLYKVCHQRDYYNEKFKPIFCLRADDINGKYRGSEWYADDVEVKCSELEKKLKEYESEIVMARAINNQYIEETRKIKNKKERKNRIEKFFYNMLKIMFGGRDEED